MSITIYLPIALVITIFFLCSYWKQRRAFQLIFGIWVPSTLLQYLNAGRTFYNILSVAELILFVVAIVSLIQDQRRRKKEAAQQEAMQQDAAEEKAGD
jgi:hypothetical protein